jgi:hypothetical protein
MHQEFPEITFDFTAKVEHILERRAIFPELGALGCVFMVSAVESLSDAVLANLEKGHTRGTRTATPSASPPSWSTVRLSSTAATTLARSQGVCSGEGRDLLPLFMARANRHRTEPLQQLDDLAMADRRPRRPNIR